MNTVLKEIFNKNYSSLCNFANALIKDRHASEDIVQSVFIQLWERDKILQLKNPSPYLLRCVKYKCIDHLKRPEKTKEKFLAQLPEIGFEEQQSLKEEDILPLLHFFADKLPPKTRQVFLLSRQSEMSYKEIAQSLKVSVKTVENQMGSALKKLRVLLKEHQYLPLLVLFF